MKSCIYTLSALAIASSLAFAQAPGKGPKGPKGDGEGARQRPNPEAMFKKLDTNNDGSLSLDEYKASPMGKRNETKAAEIFAKIDKDSDGKVTLEEFKSHRPERRPGGAGRPGKGGPKGGDAPAPPATETQ